MGPMLAAFLYLAPSLADGREAALHLREGVDLFARESFDDAERHLRRAAALAPRAAEPFYVLGRLYMATDRPDEAVKAYRTCLQNVEREPWPAAAGASHPDRPLEQEHQAVDDERLRRRRRAEVYLRLGSAHYRIGHLDAAEASFRTSLDLQPSGEAHNNLAVLLQATLRPEEAANEMAAAEKAGHPVNPLFRAEVEATLGATRQVSR